MTLTYTLGVEDVVAFNQHFCLVRQPELLPSKRGRIVFQTVGVAVVAFFTFVYGPLEGLVVIAAWYALYFLQGPIKRHFIKRSVTRVYSAAPTDPIVGTHTLSLQEAGFVSHSELGRSEWPWSRLRHVAETPAHVFLYLGIANALIIPRREVPSDVLSELLSTLRAHAPSAFPPPAANNA